MLRALLMACAAASVLVPAARAVGTAANGAPMDPQNVIADDIESEAYAALRRLSTTTKFKGPEIVVIDYRLPASAKRLYIVNLQTGAVEATYVAHGRGSDPEHTNIAYRFSDATSSGMSSVGAYRGGELYNSPEHGPALRVAGLDATNANAYDRLIVFHTAEYFDPPSGRLGRSCGCFVVTRAEMTRVYGVIADGGFLYAGPARLHDRSASTARDCNTACGNVCPPQQLIAANDRKGAPIVVAAVTPPPVAAVPAPKPRAAPPPVLVAAAPPPVVTAPVLVAAVTPAPKPKLPVPPPADFAVPVPLPKPALHDAAPAPVLTADATPIPLPKPAFDVPPLVVAADADVDGIPVPRTKPAALTAAPTQAVAAAAPDLPPMPLIKPASFALAASVVVPNVPRGEIPVPAPKPLNLQRVADAREVP